MWSRARLGTADEVFNLLWVKLQLLGWLGPNTVVVIVGDGAKWIWNRASLFANRCEILDFWHAAEHAWDTARILFGARRRSMTPRRVQAAPRRQCRGPTPERVDGCLRNPRT